MRIISRVFIAVGVIGILATIVFLSMSIIDINTLHAVAGANRSLEFASPKNKVLITTATALVSGLVTGLGIGMPRGQGRY